MSTTLKRIQEELDQELKTSTAEVARLETELTAARRDQKSIKDALSALGRPAKVVKKPTLKKADVINAMSKLLQQAARPLPVEQLEGAIREFAGKKGLAVTGIHLRMKEAIADPRFTQGEDGISLSVSTAVPA